MPVMCRKRPWSFLPAESGRPTAWAPGDAAPNRGAAAPKRHKAPARIRCTRDRILKFASHGFVASDQSGRRARGQIYQALTVSAPSLTLKIVWSQKQDNSALKLSRHIPIRVHVAHVVVSLAFTSFCQMASLRWMGFTTPRAEISGLAESLTLLERRGMACTPCPKAMV